MSARITFTEAENTDRDFPNALEVFDAEFKVNGEYVCVEPCGGGSGQHLLGDVHIYVETWGDDSFPDERDPIRTGTSDDPFASIQRAIDYIIDIVTINGTIFVHIGVGTFYIYNTIHINHPNKIEFMGEDNFISKIQFNDICISEFIGFWFGAEGFIAHGQSGITDIEYVNISILSNGQIFSDLSDEVETTQGSSSCSNGSIGLFAGGFINPLSASLVKTISYITFSIFGVKSFFGDLVDFRMSSTSCSNGFIGLFIGGYETTTHTNSMNSIENITFSSQSNASIYGTLQETAGGSGAVSDGSIGIIGGGSTGTGTTFIKTLERIVFSTSANAIIFGNLTYTGFLVGACGDTTTAVFGGRHPHITIIDCIEFASGTEAISFGNMNVGRYGYSSCANGTRGLFCGGYSNTTVTTIDYITIAIKSDATNFGDLHLRRYESSSCSGN